MNIRNRIEKFKNNMKTAGMVAAFGTMTLNSSAQTVTKDKQENKIETVEKLHKRSDTKNIKFFIDGYEFDMEYALYNAVSVGTYDDVKMVLDNGGAKYVNIPMDDSFHDTPFEAAIVRMICDEEGIQMSKTDSSVWGDTTKWQKSWEESKKKAELLISYGADVKAINRHFDDEVKASVPNTYKALTQMAARQTQLNKMKQGQGR